MAHGEVDGNCASREQSGSILSLANALQDFGDKMIVSLLKIELLSEAETMDTSEFYNGELLEPVRHHALIPLVLLRMIRTIVLNDTNFKTYAPYPLPVTPSNSVRLTHSSIMHYIHKLKEHRYT